MAGSQTKGDSNGNENGHSNETKMLVASDDEKPPDEPEKGKPKRVVTTFKLMFIAFFLTCGGPYGIEPTVQAAGPFITLVGLLALPIIYALPQSLMTAELSSMMDENGGYVIWVQRAFGDFVGWVNSYNSVICDFFDNALYPIVFVDYLAQIYPLNFWEKWAIKVAIVAAVAILNIKGIDVVSWVSAILTVAIVLPIFIEFVIRARHIHPAEQWTRIPEHINWGLFLSTILWIYGGWDSLGTIAGEVVKPAKTYPRGIALALILNTTVYVVPVIVGFTYSTSQRRWHEGYFQDVADRIAPWVQWWVLIGAMISNFGTYNAGVSSTARAMWAMGRGKYRQLPAVFGCTWDRYGTPVVSIIANSLITCVLMAFNFDILVQCDTFLDCITLMLEFAAFMYLKYKEPNTPRPYVVPGGKFGAWVITIPKVIVIGTALALSNWKIALISTSIIAVVCVAYVVRWFFCVKLGVKLPKCCAGCGGGYDTDDEKEEEKEKEQGVAKKPPAGIPDYYRVMEEGEGDSDDDDAETVRLLTAEYAQPPAVVTPPWGSVNGELPRNR